MSNDEVLAHFGVKGMRWGVRRRETSPRSVTITNKPRGGVKVRGGENQPPHPDAVTAAISKRKVRKSTVSSLSNTELQALVNRMNLERQLTQLSSKRKSEGQKFLEEQMKTVGRQSIKNFLVKRAVKPAAVAVVTA